MCCGQGTACTGLTPRQVLAASRVIAEVFGPPRAVAKLRYDASGWATMVRESREAAAYWREVFDCGQGVLERGGPVEEYLACRVEGA